MGALRAILLLALLGLGQARELQPESSALHSNPKPPVWPTSYSIKYILSQPYTAKLQPDMLSYEVTLHRDASGRDSRARLETLNGTNIMLGIAGDAEYEIVPVLDQQVGPLLCFTYCLVPPCAFVGR